MLSVSVHGLDDVLKELKDAQEAFRALEATIRTIAFNPNDENSVSAAIRQMETAIDATAAAHPGNRLVMNLAEQLKGTYRTGILERAASKSGPGPART